MSMLSHLHMYARWSSIKLDVDSSAEKPGLVAMLVAFLPVRVHMRPHPDHFPAVPVWAIWIWKPLIAWAWHYTR